MKPKTYIAPNGQAVTVPENDTRDDDTANAIEALSLILAKAQAAQAAGGHRLGSYLDDAEIAKIARKGLEAACRL